MYPIEWFPYVQDDRLFLIKYIDGSEVVYTLCKYFRNEYNEDAFELMCNNNYNYMLVSQALEYMPVDEIDTLLKEHENMYNAIEKAALHLRYMQIELEKV